MKISFKCWPGQIKYRPGWYIPQQIPEIKTTKGFIHEKYGMELKRFNGTLKFGIEANIDKITIYLLFGLIQIQMK